MFHLLAALQRLPHQNCSQLMLCYCTIVLDVRKCPIVLRHVNDWERCVVELPTAGHKIGHQYRACSDNRSSSGLGREECNPECHILNVKLLSANQQSSYATSAILCGCSLVSMTLFYCLVYRNTRDFVKMELHIPTCFIPVHSVAELFDVFSRLNILQIFFVNRESWIK